MRCIEMMAGDTQELLKQWLIETWDVLKCKSSTSTATSKND